MKITFFKKEKSFKKVKLHPDLNFFWKLAVFFLFMVILASAVFGYYLFLQTNKESTLDTVLEYTHIQTIKKERIQKVLKYFFVRAEQSNQIINSPSPVIDPSL